MNSYGYCFAVPKGRMAAIMWLHKLISCQYRPTAGKLQN